MFGWLFRRKKKQATTPPAQFLCSGCYQVHRVNDLHALPWWDPHARAFLMASRCAPCFPVSLAEARERVRAWDSESEVAFRSFLDTWKIEARMPGLAHLGPRAAAEAVLDRVQQTDGRAFADVFLGLA